MLEKFGVTIAAGIFTVAFVLPAGYADAFSEPIPIKTSLLKWGGNPRVGKLFKIVSKPVNPTLFSLPTSGATDPVATGGRVEVEVGVGGVGGRLTCTADITECGDGLACRTDADCQAPYETCEQRVPGAFRDATVRSITLQGELPDPPDLSDKLPHRGVVVTNFCAPPIFDPLLDASASLPGPGAVTMDGDLTNSRRAERSWRRGAEQSIRQCSNLCDPASREGRSCRRGRPFSVFVEGASLFYSRTSETVCFAGRSGRL